MSIKIKPSKRERIGLRPDELAELQAYCSDMNRSPFATIRNTARIDYNTVKRMISSGGFAERDVVFRMRDFLKALKSNKPC